jgi:hypothetical protein
LVWRGGMGGWAKGRAAVWDGFGRGGPHLAFLTPPRKLNGGRSGLNVADLTLWIRRVVGCSYLRLLPPPLPPNSRKDDCSCTCRPSQRVQIIRDMIVCLNLRGGWLHRSPGFTPGSHASPSPRILNSLQTLMICVIRDRAWENC